MGLEPFRLPWPLVLLLGRLGMLDAESEREMCEGDSGMVGSEWNDALPCAWAFIVRRLGRRWPVDVGRGSRKGGSWAERRLSSDFEAGSQSSLSLSRLNGRWVRSM